MRWSDDGEVEEVGESENGSERIGQRGWGVGEQKREGRRRGGRKEIEGIGDREVRKPDEIGIDEVGERGAREPDEEAIEEVGDLGSRSRMERRSKMSGIGKRRRRMKGSEERLESRRLGSREVGRRGVRRDRRWR